MKTITVKQPLASLIVDGIKDIENRTWRCPKKYIGKRVLIHASASIDKSAIDRISTIDGEIARKTWFNLNDNQLPLGAIIGSVEIVDCVINHSSIWAEKTELPYLGDVLEDIHHFGKSLKPDNIAYNWVLANPTKFHEPFPTKGKLNFWDYPKLDEELLEAFIVKDEIFKRVKSEELNKLKTGTYNQIL